MGNKKEADVQLIPKTGEEIEDALLDRYVECRGRFVRHQQCRARQYCQSDQHALQHPSGQLVRIGIVNPLRIVETHLGEGFENKCPADRWIGLFCQRCRFQRLGADCSHRIERVAGILRHEADFTAAKRPEAAFW
ncbi:hypothetical protein D3C72_1162790 [compost metagenome]